MNWQKMALDLFISNFILRMSKFAPKFRQDRNSRVDYAFGEIIDGNQLRLPNEWSLSEML
jgi:hypothetical protein